MIESSAKFAGTGCPGACQSCGKTKVDLVFDDVETTRLVGIKCLHMKGIGRRCAWGKEITAENKAQLLHIPLRDSAEGDLARVKIGVQ